MQAGVTTDVTIKCSFLEIYNEVRLLKASITHRFPSYLVRTCDFVGTRIRNWPCSSEKNGPHLKFCSLATSESVVPPTPASIGVQVITDLLNPEATHLLIREDAKKGIYVERLSQHIVHKSVSPSLTNLPCNVPVTVTAALSMRQVRSLYIASARCLLHPGVYGAVVHSHGTRSSFSRSVMPRVGKQAIRVFTVIGTQGSAQQVAISLGCLGCSPVGQRTTVKIFYLALCSGGRGGVTGEGPRDTQERGDADEQRIQPITLRVHSRAVCSLVG